MLAAANYLLNVLSTRQERRLKISLNLQGWKKHTLQILFGQMETEINNTRYHFPSSVRNKPHQKENIECEWFVFGERPISHVNTMWPYLGIEIIFKQQLTMPAAVNCEKRDTHELKVNRDL